MGMMSSMPSASLAASDMRTLVHGGSNVRFELDAGDAGNAAHGARSASAGRAAGDRTVERGEGHAEIDMAGLIDIDAVDQAEFVDVDRHFRIEDFLRPRQ